VGVVSNSQNEDNKVHLTKEGLSDLQRELSELKNEKRPEAVERLATARTLGDLEGNNEYNQSKQDLTLMDGRIAELQEIIANAAIIKTGKATTDQVGLGSRVTVVLEDREITFFLVGEWEADPASQKISHKSPLGQKLLGKKPGDTVEVEAPIGKLVYKIVKIE
jgi:transcription elongation factor GreA